MTTIPTTATSEFWQDAAYMVTVPFFCRCAILRRSRRFLYYEDRFTKLAGSLGDIVVGIDDTIEKQLAAVAALESQFYEGGCNGGPQLVSCWGNRARRCAARGDHLARFG